MFAVERLLKRCAKAIRYAIAYFALVVPSGLNRKSLGATESRLIVALTSYPGRIGRVDLTVRSLLRQDVVPQKVVLVLSSLEFPDGMSSLPKRLLKLLRFSGESVEVLFTGDNKRSYKKLLPVLSAYPEDTIVTADDDVLYPSDWLRQLYDGHLRFPDAIIGTRGTIIGIQNQSIRPYSTWKRATLDVPRHDVFLTGRGGILYPAGSLSPLVEDWITAADLCPTADDIWFKAMAVLADTKCLTVPIRSEYLPNTLFEKNALWHENVLEGRNDEALMRVVERFQIFEKLDESGS